MMRAGDVDALDIKLNLIEDQGPFQRLAQVARGLDYFAGIQPSWSEAKRRKMRLLFLTCVMLAPILSVIISVPSGLFHSAIESYWIMGLMGISALFLVAVRFVNSETWLGVVYGLWLVLMIGLGPVLLGDTDSPALLTLVLVPLIMGFISGATASAVGTLMVLCVYYGVVASAYAQHDDTSLASLTLIAYCSISTMLCGVMVSYFAKLTHIESSALSQDNARIRTMAMTDPLTRRKNRRAFQVAMERLMVQSSEERQPALCILDLDRFKQINDTHGHDVGDQVLKEFSRRLKSVVGEGREVYRLGGDEFAILSANEPELSELNALGMRVTEIMRKPIETNSASIECDVSIGIAVSDGSVTSIQSLYQQADTAAFVAKEKPGSNHVIFDTILDDQANRKFQIERALKIAIQHRTIDVAFQPQVDLRTGQIKAYEALARWHDAILGNISPGEFVEIAEETSLVQVLDRLIMFKALQSAGQWLGDDQRVSVNVSARSLNSREFSDFVLKQIENSRLRPEQVEVEITETTLIENWQKSKRIVEALGAAGVRIVLDDFGVGYSSLSYLVEFPVQKIKFDRSFLLKASDPTSALVMESITDLAMKMGLDLVAEGIESKEQMNLLKRIKCYTGQGYLLGRPIKSAKMIEHASQKRTAA